MSRNRHKRATVIGKCLNGAKFGNLSASFVTQQAMTNERGNPFDIEALAECGAASGEEDDGSKSNGPVCVSHLSQWPDHPGVSDGADPTVFSSTKIACNSKRSEEGCCNNNNRARRRPERESEQEESAHSFEQHRRKWLAFLWMLLLLSRASRHFRSKSHFARLF